MRTKFAIIGGGIAGLCAAIRLTELGEEPLLIEGGSYPTHKICGEFLSPECIQYLHDWDIHPTSISKAVLRTHSSSLTFPFPTAAGGMSHMQLGPALASYVTKYGGKLRTNTHVKSFQPKQSSYDAHLIQLESGENLEVSHVIIATGRIPGYPTQAPQMCYMGFKSHFKNIVTEGNLEMYSFPGAYLGIAPIEDNKYNVACLANLKEVGRFSSPHLFIENLIAKNPFTNTTLSAENNLFGKWMTATIPAFGIKKTPDWLDTYFIGDAAVTIPPACGNGLAMGILGGRLAAEYAVRLQSEKFKKMWVKRCSFQMFWGKLLHKILLNPSYGSHLLKLGNTFPYLTHKIFELTRQSEKAGVI
ncbi:MAG: FAD-dependent oxidoreductase [Parachlamydiaceae bacterium]|nr:FAD-dependent oxidoreductase [Parachlamydiaceae bacterium]